MHAFEKWAVLRMQHAALHDAVFAAQAAGTA